jgi:GNAT superfamily N-acetyltransferase
MPAFKLKSGEDVIIRPSNFADISQMASIAVAAYSDDKVTRFLAPHREKYPQDYYRHYLQSYRTRYLDPKSQGFVAVLASSPSVALGFIQLARLGSDAGAQKVIASRSSFSLKVLGLFYKIKHRVENYLFPDRSMSKENMDMFLTWVDYDTKTYWSNPLYENRWQAQTVIVAPKWQGNGIGKMLMNEVIKRAKAENEARREIDGEQAVPVVIGLQSSPAGEFMYRKVGFRLLGRFQDSQPGEAGGSQIWEPPNGTPFKGDYNDFLEEVSKRGK